MEGGLAPVACGFGGESKKGKAAEVWIPLDDDETEEEVETDEQEEETEFERTLVVEEEAAAWGRGMTV